MQTDMFKVGEVINSMGDIGRGITIEVLELLPDENLRVKLTKVNARWIAQGFAVDEERILEKKIFLNAPSWSFQQPVPSPFLIVIENGKKVFML